VLFRSQQVKWEKVKDDRGKTIDHYPETAFYECEHCASHWSDADRWEAVTKGHWEATAPFKGIAGFHLPQFLSPWIVLEDIVQEFLEAQGHPELLQVWTNTVLADVWEERGKTADGDGLKTHVEDYDQYELPDGVHFATASIDVQDDRLEIEVVGWGEHDETWGILHDVVYGDPSLDAVWTEAADIIFDRFWTEGDRLVTVRAACVDYGGHHGAEAIKFATRYKKRNVYAIKGRAGVFPVWPKRVSKTKDGDPLRLLGVDSAKDTIYARYKITDPGPGYCHFNSNYDDDWFKQATVEFQQTRYSEGRPYRVWVCPKGKRNEALDCRVYATAARMSLTPRQCVPSRVIAGSSDRRAEIVKAERSERELQPAKRGRRMRSRGIR